MYKSHENQVHDMYQVCNPHMLWEQQINKLNESTIPHNFKDPFNSDMLV